MTRASWTGIAAGALIAASLVSAATSPAARRTKTVQREATLQPHPKPSLVSGPEYYGSWAVGCDNVLRCEALSLQSDDVEEGGERPAELQIVREGGPRGEISLRARSLDTLPEQLRLIVDGREVARLRAPAGGEPEIAGAPLLGIARTMAAGVTIELRDKSKRLVGTVPVAGLSDSLRYMDNRQGRGANVTAFVAPGERPASEVPPQPPVPEVWQMPSPEADSAAALDAREMATARSLAQCDPGLVVEGATELYPLDRNSALILLPCEAGAYNISAVPLIARGAAGARSIGIARFDQPPGATGEPGRPPLVVNALWDARRGVLSSLAKGRGIGDCGASEAYVWDGAMFRLIESRAMHQCRGASDWIRLWTAKPMPLGPG